jgi:hypothetical protein
VGKIVVITGDNLKVISVTGIKPQNLSGGGISPPPSSPLRRIALGKSDPVPRIDGISPAIYPILHQRRAFKRDDRPSIKGQILPVIGFLPRLGAFFFTWNFPNPLIRTSSPDSSAFLIRSKRQSTTAFD